MAQPSTATIVTLVPTKATSIKVQAGKHYQVRKPGSQAQELQVPDNLIATRQGDALQVRYADGSVLRLEDFYAVCKDASICSVNLAGDDAAGYTLSGDHIPGSVASGDGGTLVYAHGQQDVLMSMAQGQTPMQSALGALGDAPVLTYLPASSSQALVGSALGAEAAFIPALAGVMGAAGGLAGLTGSLPAALPSSILLGTIHAGPVIASNDLRVDVLAANAISELSGRVQVDAQGNFSANVGSHLGVVIAKLVNAGVAGDYLDEATNSAKDLNAVLMAAGVVSTPGSTLNLNLNVLTTIAFQLLGSDRSAANVLAVNAAVARAFGLAALHGTAVVPTNGGGYNPGDGLSEGEKYGAILSALSGMDKLNGGDVQATIDQLVAQLSISGSSGVLSDAGKYLVSAGAKIVAAQAFNLGVVTSLFGDDVAGLINYVPNTDSQAEGLTRIGNFAGAGSGTAPTLFDYANANISGIDSAGALSLINTVIRAKARADVDTVAEVQALADAVAAVLAGAAGGSPATQDQLALLGITGVTADNLAAVLAAIAATPDDGSGVDTLAELQALVSAAAAAAAALGIISGAAQANSATSTTPGLDVYTDAGVTGVNANNLAAINDALNSGAVVGSSVDTTAEVQALVNAYNAILASADGADNVANGANPSQTQYALIGVTGVDSSAKTSLLGDVIDTKASSAVDSVAEVQALADAVAAVVGAANGGTAPTLAQLQLLGITGVTADNLPAIQQAIDASANDGSGVDTLSELQTLVSNAAAAAAAALGTISAAAQANSATSTTPAISVYTDAGVTGVTAGNLAAINDALNSGAVLGTSVDTTAEVQALVNAYNAILASADGADNVANGANPSQAQYALIGVTGVDSSAKTSLLGDVIDTKASSAVDSVAEVQALADAVAAVIGSANGGTAPTLAQLQLLGISDVNADNLPAIQQAIDASANDGSGVDTLSELQTLVSNAAAAAAAALGTISAAAQANSATSTTPAISVYTDAGVTGVTAGNLAAINDALNSGAVVGSSVDTTAEVQALVNAYNAILASADGVDNVANGANPSQAQYALIGVTGVDSGAKTSLLGDVIDTKGSSAVESVAELQALADAVAAVVGAANGGNAPTLAQLQLLGITGVTADNLAAIQQAIDASANDGSGVDTLSELQTLVSNAAAAAAAALGTISAAAQGNNATSTTPAISVYTDAGVTGVTAGNLAAINDALNSGAVVDTSVDTTAEVQGVVDAYAAILAEANGASADATPGVNPGASLYARIGADIGLAATDAENLALLNDIVAAQSSSGVDAIAEINNLARIANAIALLVAGGTPSPALTPTDLSTIGLTGTDSVNLTDLINTLAAQPDDGSGTDTLAKLQNLVNNSQPAAPVINPITADDVVNATEAAAGFAITGTGRAGATVTLSFGSGVVPAGGASVVVGSDGTWSLPLSSSDVLALGQGAETITAVQAGSNGTSSQPRQTQIDIDTVAPSTTIASVTLGADTGSSGTDFITNTAAQTLSGTLGANLLAGETVYVSLDNGSTWVGASSSIGSNTWSLAGQTLSGSGTLRIKVSDSAGNDGTVLSQAYVLDTLAPANTVASATLSADTGISATDFVTRTAAQTLSGTLSANRASDESVWVSLDGGSNWQAALSAAGSNTWSLGGLTLGSSNTLQVRLRDSAGNEGPVFSQAYVLDSTAPSNTIATVALSADSGSSASDFITNTAAQTLSGTLSANLAAGEAVYVSLDNGSTWLTATATTGSNSWSLAGQTLTASNTLKVKVADSAGNDGAILSQTYVLDTTAPVVNTVTDDVSASLTSGNINFTVTFSEALVGTVDTSSFTASNGTVTGVTALGANQYRVSVTPQSNVANGSVALSLVGSGLSDSAGNAVANADLSAKDSQGIDTLAAALNVTSIAGDAVAGQNQTGVYDATERGTSPTAVATALVIAGTTTAEAGQTATLTLNNLNYQATVVAGSGGLNNWSVTLPDADVIALNHGNNYRVLVSVQDAAGSVSTNNSDLLFYNVARPDIPTIFNNFTNDSTPILSGLAKKVINIAGDLSDPANYRSLEAGDTLQVTVNGVTLNATIGAGSATNLAGVSYSASTSTWTVDSAAAGVGVLADGSYEVAVSVTAGGITKTDISQNELVVNTALPVITLDPVSGGSINATEKLQDLAITGTTDAQVGQTVTLTFLGTPYTASVRAGADPAHNIFAFSIPASALAAVADASYPLSASVTNIYGSSQQATPTVVVDTQAPVVTAVTDNVAASLANGSIDFTVTFGEALVGSVGTGNFTATNGTVSAVSSLGSNQYRVSVTPTANLASGTVALSLVGTGLTDAAGNTVQSANLASFDSQGVDTLAPTLSVGSVALSADTAANGASNTDFNTGTATQTITATLSAPLGAGDVLLGSVDGGATWLDISNLVSGTAITWTGATLSGSSTIVFKISDASGNTGPNTGSTAYVLDTLAPSTNIASASFSADTAANGSSNSDFVTDTAAQTISGTLSANLAAGETVYVSLDNGSSWTAATATVGSTSWSLAGQTLAGSNTLKVKVSDSAGNDGTVYSQAYVLDTTAPTTTIATVQFSADAGSSSTDLITNTASQTISGTLSANLAAGESVYVSFDAGASWTLASATTGNNSWSLAGQTLSGSNTLLVKLADLAGNNGTSLTQSYSLDQTAPTLVITDNKAATVPITGGDIIYTFTFSEAVTGFDASKVTVANGSKGTFTTLSATQYTLAVTPNAGFEGNVTVDVASSAAADIAGNASTAAAQNVQTVDRLAPTLAITSNVSTLKADETATITFTFSEDPSSSFSWDGSTGDVVVSGGTLGAISGSGLTRTATFTPSAGLASGTASITVAGSTYTDAAGNNGGAGTSPSISIDTLAPTLSITSNVSTLKAGETATITFTFSEDPSSSFAWNGSTGDVVVSSGTLGAISGSGLTRTATFTPTASLASGTASITVAGSTYTDAAGNNGGAGTTPSISIDTLAPTLSITSNVSSLKAGETATITFTFSEDPGSSFAWNGSTGDVVVSGGTLGAISGSGLTRTATFTPTAGLASGTASITVTSGAYTDAAGNSGGAGTSPSISIDTLAPTLAITSNVSTLKAGETATITFTFSEDPGSSFAWNGSTGDVVVSGGTLGAISGSGLTRTATFTPTAGLASGTASITVAGSTYTDAAGNSGGAGTSPSISIDTLAPTLSITSNVSSLKAGETATITFTFSEDPSSSFAWNGSTGDVVVSGGTLGAISGSGLTRTATFTPTASLASGTASITVASGTYTDAAGNSGGAGTSPSISIDTLAPTLSITSNVSSLKAGETATITFTFSEDPGSSFAWDGSTGDVVVSGGTLGAISGSGLTRTATFTPTAGLASGTASITVASSTYTDAAGNNGGAGTTPSISIDTLAPTATLVAGSTTSAGTATVQSTETGTAYLVDVSSITVTDLASITNSPLTTKWKQLTIGSANTAIGASLSGLANGNYVLYTVDAAGNLSAASSAQMRVVDSVTTLNLASLTSNSWGLAIDGVEPYAGDNGGIGVSVSAAGDINGDGYGDFVIGAPDLQDYLGRAYVVFGKPDFSPADLSTFSALTISSRGFFIEGLVPIDVFATPFIPGDRVGFSVASAGDINGDGLADVLFGAPGKNYEAGIVYVVYGKTNTDTINLATFESQGRGFAIEGLTGSSLGSSVSSAGDVNGDGYSDLIIGAYGGAGRTYVVFGGPNVASVSISDLASGVGGFAINGLVNPDSLGYSVSSAGDINGDGFADLLASAPYTNSYKGTSYVIFGKSQFTTPVTLTNIAAGTGGFAINGEQANDSAGLSVSSAGDVNGDGFADIVVGAPYYGINGTGKTYVIFGQASFTSPINLANVGGSTAGFVINGSNMDYTNGYSVSSAGDVNGDGLADLIIGSAYSSAPNLLDYPGRAYIVYGKTGSGAVDLVQVAAGVGGFAIEGSANTENLGGSVSSAGDINGDGLADLLVGGPKYDPLGGFAYHGRVYVIFGGQQFATTVDLMGGTGNDTLTGSSTGETIVGGAGNDTLVGNGGADVLYGGVGNDTLVLTADNIAKLVSTYSSGDGQLARLDGGTGFDTIRLSGGASLDLSQIANVGAATPNGLSRINSVEKIDLASDSNANTLTLAANDVVDMAGMNLVHTGTASADGNTWTNLAGVALSSTTSLHQLVVDGGSNDSVALSAANGYWYQAGTVSNGSASFVLYQNDYSHSQVLVRSGVVVNNLTTPTAPTFALATDSGSSSSDGITNVATVNVSGLMTSATWEYRVDGGAWNLGTGSSFILTSGAHSYAVRQTGIDANVYTSGSTSFTLDTSAPTATLTAATTTSAGSATVQSSEVGTAYLVKSTVSVTSLADITNAVDANWNSAAITTASSNTSLALTGLVDGTYRLYTVDGAGNLSSASSNTVTIAAAGPTVNSIALTSATGMQNSTLNAGDVVTATVTFSEAVTVSGTPHLALHIGSDIVQANYAAGSGGTALTFSYTILSNQTDTNGISIDANSMSLNTGTILSTAASTPATLTHVAVTDNSGFLVDTLAPTVTVSDDVTGTAIGTVRFNFAFNETVTGFTSSSINVTGGTKGTLTGSGSSYAIDVTPTGTSGNMTVGVNTGGFSDLAGNVNTTATTSDVQPFDRNQTIDLGVNGKLIDTTEISGNWYYYWDRNGNGWEDAGDTVDHNVLDGIFNQNISGTTHSGDTTDTFRFASLTAASGAAVKVGLPNDDEMLAVLSYWISRTDFPVDIFWTATQVAPDVHNALSMFQTFYLQEARADTETHHVFLRVL